ncbi:YveK family protein [Lapidilactobacillus dextrinicus]|uniref:YveK family protein n=1 Tax=Lapidilactobacillus dextrinicus TaxID=51664 RepID=UPI0022E6D47B|nr:Wzz/FepE/Etk N-terminal domain-containing protein [Lapidilactobacillus dextrinicus]
MEQAISLESLFRILRKNLRLIVISTVVGTILAAIITFFIMTPKYSASVDILVNRKQDNAVTNQLSDQQADVQMINTYKDIITKAVTLDPVRKEVKEQLGYDVSTDQLREMISVTNQQNSQVFSVSVKDTDAARSATIANIIAKTFKKKVAKILEVNNVSIIAKATKPKSAVSPRKKLNIAIGLVVGLFFGVGLALLSELTDHNVKDMEYLTDELGLTKLGMVGHYHTANSKKKKGRSRAHRSSTTSTRRQTYQTTNTLTNDQAKVATSSADLTASEPVQPIVKTASSQVTAPQASSRASRLRTNDDLPRRQSQKRI